MFCFIINMYLCLQSRCPLVWFLVFYHILPYVVSQNDLYSKCILFCHFMAVSACLTHNFFPPVWLGTSPLQPDDSSQLVSSVWQFFLFPVAGFPLFFTLFTWFVTIRQHVTALKFLVLILFFPISPFVSSFSSWFVLLASSLHVKGMLEASIQTFISVLLLTRLPVCYGWKMWW